MKSKILRVVIEPTEDFFKEFKNQWKAAEKRAPFNQKENEIILSFPSFGVMAKVLTSERWKLLSAVRKYKPESINQLAKILGRAQPNVQRDVNALVELGVLELKKSNSKKKIHQPFCEWDRFEIPLVA